MNDDTPVDQTGHKTGYQLTMKAEEGYLLVHVSGRRTRAAVFSMMAEIVKAAVEHQRVKILMDAREFEGHLGVFESYFIVSEDFQPYQRKGVTKVAIVDRPLPDSPEWFFELVARNRGFNLRIFENPVEALDWLLAAETDRDTPNDPAGSA